MSVRWRERFEAGGIEALKKDLPRGDRPPSIDAAKIKQIAQLTTQSTPKHATQWSTCLMAECVGGCVMWEIRGKQGFDFICQVCGF